MYEDPIALPLVTKYQLFIPELPLEVKVVGHFLGWIEELKYVDHFLTHAEKFPWFQPNHYLKVTTNGQCGEVIVPLGWAKNLHRATILSTV